MRALNYCIEIVFEIMLLEYRYEHVQITIQLREWMDAIGGGEINQMNI